MDHHHRHVPAHAPVMDGARHHLFSGPAFARDEHRGISGRGHVDELPQPLDGRALPDQVRSRIDLLHAFAQLLQFPPCPVVRNGVAHGMREFIRIHGFGDVVVGALLQRPHRRLHGRVSGHDDHGQARVRLFQPALQFHPIHAGHLDIEQSQVERAPRQRRQGLFPVRRRLHLIALVRKPLLQGLPDYRLIVHNQDRSPRTLHCFSPRAWAISAAATGR